MKTQLFDLKKFSEANVWEEPFRYATIPELLNSEIADDLLRNIPRKNLYRSIRDVGSDKTYNVANNLLIDLGSDTFKQADVSSSWNDLLESLRDSVYIESLSKLLKIDLTKCYLDVTFKEYSFGDYISNHTDRPGVTATHLLFFNKYWESDWGGELVFSRDDGVPFRSFPPIYNYSVAFVRTDNSWHKVTPITQHHEKRTALQVAFWNTSSRQVLEGRIITQES